MDHDQNFKNLILDYPRAALEFFAAEEIEAIAGDPRILPIRQEQLKQRLGDHFRELDIPLLVEWPDGRRAALLFVLEEESDPRRFSIHRLAHYCLDLAELYQTDRVIPVVIFLRAGNPQYRLALGGDRHSYLQFDYLARILPRLPSERYLESDNIVARLNLPNMSYPAEAKVAVYAQAVRGLTQLEDDPDKQLKYLDFIDIYADLDDNEMEQYQREYPEEAEQMSTFAERFREEGMQQGMQQGIQQGMQKGMQRGEAAVLLRLLQRKFGTLEQTQRQRVESADADTLLEWSERILTAESIEEVLH